MIAIATSVWLNVIKAGGSVSNWILATGFWRDDGAWRDSATWID